jgi:ParB family chromosome partitioning protein
MASTARKTRAPKAPGAEQIVIAAPRAIAFDRLTLTDHNIRRLNTNVSVQDLADDIARRGLLQSLNVRPLAGGDLHEVVAGGRRYRALALLVSQGRMAPDQEIPCIVGAGATAQEDSLAENVHRLNLHPVEQYRAFQIFKDQGLADEEIARRFNLSTRIVAQRLKLAGVAPALLDAYVAEDMTLETLTVFTLCDDQERQLQVWNDVKGSWRQEPGQLRRILTETKVSGADGRARLVGIEAYEGAGGTVLRDLFSDEESGTVYLEDVALLDRMVTEVLVGHAHQVASEGWKWIKVGEQPDHAESRVRQQFIAPTEEASRVRADHQHEAAQIEASYESLTEDEARAADERLEEIETALAQMDAAHTGYAPLEIPHAGAYVFLGHRGQVEVARGYVKAEDAQALSRAPSLPERETSSDDGAASPRAAAISIAGEEGESQESETVKPLSAALVLDLSIHKTLALRDTLSVRPELALVALIHNLVLRAFPARHCYASMSPLDIKADMTSRQDQAVGIADADYVTAFQARHDAWAARLPLTADDYLDFISDLSRDDQLGLLAHCVAQTIDMTIGAYDGPSVEARATGEIIAARAGLDVSTGWRPTVANYLGRVAKARILEAVIEGKSEGDAQLITHLKKGEMAKEAQRMLAGTAWLPVELRTLADEVADSDEADPAQGDDPGAADADVELPAFMTDPA